MSKIFKYLLLSQNDFIINNLIILKKSIINIFLFKIISYTIICMSSKLIWSNHILERLKKRGIRKKDVWLTWYKPDQSRYAKSKGAWIYYKTINNFKIEVVAKQNEKKEWLIISAWKKPAPIKNNPSSIIQFLLRKIFLKDI